MKRIAGAMTFASLALIAHSCAHLEAHFGAPRTPLAMQQVPDDPLVASDSLISNGIDGGRPPAEHVDD